MRDRTDGLRMIRIRLECPYDVTFLDIACLVPQLRWEHIGCMHNEHNQLLRAIGPNGRQDHVMYHVVVFISHSGRHEEIEPTLPICGGKVRQVDQFVRLFDFTLCRGETVDEVSSHPPVVLQLANSPDHLRAAVDPPGFPAVTGSITCDTVHR